MNSCAFTRHRPSRFEFGYDENQPLCKTIKRAMLEQCVRLPTNRNPTGISCKICILRLLSLVEKSIYKW